MYLSHQTPSFTLSTFHSPCTAAARLRTRFSTVNPALCARRQKSIPSVPKHGLFREKKKNLETSLPTNCYARIYLPGVHVPLSRCCATLTDLVPQAARRYNNRAAVQFLLRVEKRLPALLLQLSTGAFYRIEDRKRVWETIYQAHALRCSSTKVW